MLFVQIIIYCVLFTLLVKICVIGGAENALYFYPKPVQERTFEIGLAKREDIAKKRKAFLVFFLPTMLIALILIVGLWNSVSDFKTAYFQSLLFLEIMNWYDGIVIDRFWVGHDKFWILPGTEDIPFVKTWKQIFVKRSIGSVVYILFAAIPAGIVVWIF